MNKVVRPFLQTQLVWNKQGIVPVASDPTCVKLTNIMSISLEPTCVRWTKYRVRFFRSNLYEMNKALCPLLQIQLQWKEENIVSVSSDPAYSEMNKVGR